MPGKMDSGAKISAIYVQEWDKPRVLPGLSHICMNTMPEAHLEKAFCGKTLNISVGSYYMVDNPIGYVPIRICFECLVKYHARS